MAKEMDMQIRYSMPYTPQLMETRHNAWAYQNVTLPKGSQNSSALRSAAGERLLYWVVAHSLLLLLCDKLLARC